MRFLLALIFFLAISCGSNIETGKDLTQSDLKFVANLGILDIDEEIILFNMRSSIETGGSFFSNKRIAGYWIDQYKNTAEINSAYYTEIDTIILIDRTDSWTYSSLFKVIKKDNSEFNIYVDGDKKELNHFYKKSLFELNKR